MAIDAQGGRKLGACQRGRAKAWWLAWDFLRAVSQGQPTALSGKVVIWAAATVAIDVPTHRSPGKVDSVDMYSPRAARRCLLGRGD